jgi:hypothetical protein
MHTGPMHSCKAWKRKLLGQVPTIAVLSGAVTAAAAAVFLFPLTTGMIIGVLSGHS